METASMRLLELARAALGGVSYYRLAKEMNVTQSAISKWRAGEHMNNSHVVRAAALARLPPLEWIVRVCAEREPEGVRETFGEAVLDLDAMRAGRRPKRGGLIAVLAGFETFEDAPPPKRRARGGAAAGLAAATLAGLLSVASPGSAEARGLAGLNAAGQSIHYAIFGRRSVAALPAPRIGGTTSPGHATLDQGNHCSPR